jgi:tRNA dimethylallyltransferase
MTSPQPIYVVGPTASGKSAVAMALAESIGGEIVNADAFQLYRGLDIITAKPSAADLARVPHHLYGVLDPNAACDAQQYHDLALPVIAEITSRGKWPIIVGGSGLYVKSLTHGLAPLPKADLALRAELAAMTAEQRVAELLRLDPEAAMNVPLTNDRYVGRALEVCILSGEPQSKLRQTWAQQPEPNFIGLHLTRERDDLYARINLRVGAMVEAGALEEVQGLMIGPHPSPLPCAPQGVESSAMGEGACHSPTHSPAHDDLPLPSGTSLRDGHDMGEGWGEGNSSFSGLSKAIGVRELHAHLTGSLSLPAAIDAMQQSTRRYAKRQGSWFRRERGFQTVCLPVDSTPELALPHLLSLLPCPKLSPPSAPSLSI